MDDGRKGEIMKKILLSQVIALLLLPAAVSAESVTLPNMFYESVLWIEADSVFVG